MKTAWLKRLVTSSFGTMTLIFGMASIGTVSGLLMNLQEYGMNPEVNGSTPSERWVSVLAAWGSRLIFLTPPALTLLFGVTWWKIRQGAASARGWAIAASVAIGLQSIPLGIPVYLMWKDATFRVPTTLILLAPVFLLLGVAGVVLFAPHDSISGDPRVAERAPRARGDGTSGLFDLLGLFLALAGYLYGQRLWRHWAVAHHLHRSNEAVFWSYLFLAILIETFLHECGHTLVGLRLKMKLKAFVVGPFQWRHRQNAWKFEFSPTKILSGGGLAAMAPTDSKWSRRNQILFVAAGPLASLCTGFLAMALTFAIAGTRYQQFWQLFSMVSTFGFVAFGINLIPQRPKAHYSDGAHIYQLLANGPMADYHRVAFQVSSVRDSSTRPRDYDIALIEKTAEAFPTGHQGLGLRLFAFDHYLDSGQDAEAYRAIGEAERISGELKSKMHSSWYLCFVFGHAYVGGDAVQARKWWDRLQEQTDVEVDSFYWRSKSALLLAENDRDGAREAWSTGYVLAGLEPTGSAEYGLDCYERLRKALEESSNQPVIPSEQALLSQA